MAQENEERVILVVDDDPGVRRLISQTLGDSGYVVCCAETVAQARELLAQTGRTIGLVLLDMLMPGTSGLDLAAEMSRDFPECKILYVSGCRSSAALQGIQLCSPESVLFKPFNGSELLRRVEHLLQTAAQ